MRSQKGFWQIFVIFAVIAIIGALFLSNQQQGQGQQDSLDSTPENDGGDSLGSNNDVPPLPQGVFLACGKGAENVPRVKYSWNWNDISSSECDADNADYIYCDATQFSISLLKKLNEYREESLERENVEQFEVYLMKDNYTDAFVYDFDEAFRNIGIFGGVPSWYLEEEDGFWKVFKDFTFSQTVAVPGKYKVTVNNLPNPQDFFLNQDYVQECV